ncbi:serine/threonine-protein kinase [Pullulanibacillus pueri]|uniref:Serine/threonine-protein kinase PrkC n=1 Tax=Pullulanibacillus pueri TaxID=1437324 RepID=A0A8J2ZRS1_9BACL|nr:Stk1 family PASTA domain-containing Ser/Thr kinase [Pullulanibacillus pueri]MBM7680184.1 serine/threonine-protein kinase [Pullulanibacillus pueri]GGH74780.1 serine/threonine-protein kinase PrkC [Pullulanibacillus pueri]
MIGKRLNDRYKIISRVGDGGMAVVYKAKDLILDRFCAVKILRQQFSNDEAFIRRFRREAESVSSLSHANIVNIYDIGEEDDLYYIVMEYVDGTTLKTYIKHFAPVPPENAVYILKQIAAAIEHAHEHGIVHRDIKPQNILIDDQDQVKVTDFGIALGLTSATITYTNSILGSAHYLSPEQARGGKATVKSDIYGFGIVMYEMLTGQLPFPGDTPVSVALKHLNDDFIHPRELNPNLPQSLENIILRSLAKNPDDRFDSMGDLYDDLTTALNPERINEPKFSLANEDDPGETKVMVPLTNNQSSPHDSKASVSAPEENGDEEEEEETPTSKKKEKKKDKGTKEKKGKKKKRAVLFITIAILLLAIIVAALFLVPKWLRVDTVAVPKVKGLTYEQAADKLEAKEFKVKRKNVTDEDAPSGVVVSQNPEAGEKIKKKSTVTLSVSKGPEKETIQDYVGYDIETVKQLGLEDKFKDVIYKGVASADDPVGQVIAQTPDAGSENVPSDTVLQITYSTGPEKITIPNIKGDSKEDAKTSLENLGFKVAYAEGDYSDDIEEGHVLKTDPSFGSTAEEGTEITVYLSKGKELEPRTTVEPITVTVKQAADSGDDDKPGNDKDNGNQNHNSNNGKGNPPDKGDDETQPVNVVIYYTDAKHDHEQFVNESITETKVYNLPLTVDPEGKASYQVFKDGQLIEDKTIKYDDIKD